MSDTSKLDPEGMRDSVLDWPSLLEQGYGTTTDVPAGYRQAKQVVFCGMGGSAIGAGVLGDYLAPQLQVPYVVHRDYGVPGFVGADTLVVCVSHSGGTEETLSAYDEAKRRGAKLVAVTTGGVLAERAQADAVPLVRYASTAQPRAAMPQVFGILLRMADTLKLTDGHADAVPDAVAHLRQVMETLSGTTHHAAAELAGQLHGKLPVVLGSGLTTEAARRFKGQVAENAKQTAAWDVVPEQNHNAIVGFDFPDDLREHAVFVLLRTEYEHPRHRLRFEFIEDALAERDLPSASLHGAGPNRLSHLLTVILLGDLASVLLAEKNKVDPTPVDVITELKARLAGAE